MTPSVVTVRWRRPDGTWRRVNVSVAPVLLALSPLLLLAVLGALVVHRAVRADIDVSEAARGLRGLVRALPGAEFAFEQGSTAVLVSVI
ncbi:hypothetical protein Ait01nite_068330 [Actinoplanes italicus]|uniref:Uncharacterized protein n=1 Tax=Actinoplanes italicus TaxID=113567 RepID=A0A2T0K1A2_9ACTN|nr:hypothetical protein [Actinoplanes italicus]PRX16581.1 hypothetical protein CLV67_119162 [Actinoplanes italicus]GIE33788.1 hypothetical protein Ait01nite_068330 [Actinoplanes italicus]